MSRERLKAKKIDIPGLERFINEIARDLDPATVILHGSLAKGGFVEKLSDVDLIVISSRLGDVDARERFIRLLEASQRHSLKADVTAYTPQEFLEMIKELNPFALDAVFYGVPLYDKDGLWRIASKEFEKSKEKYDLRKTESDGWIWRKGGTKRER